MRHDLPEDSDQDEFEGVARRKAAALARRAHLFVMHYGDQEEHGDRHRKKRREDRPHLLLNELHHHELTRPDQIAKEQIGPITEARAGKHSGPL